MVTKGLYTLFTYGLSVDKFNTTKGEQQNKMKAETEQKKIRYEAEPKPELDNITVIRPDTQEFSEPEKAEAIIRHLQLKTGDTIRENDGYYVINPRYELQGESPEHYKKTINNLKKILTKQEIQAISKAISKNTKDYNKKLYDRITKKTDKFYYRQNIKKSLPQEIKGKFGRLDRNC